MASATEVIAIAALFPILVTSREATVETESTPQKTSLVLATEQELDMALVPDKDSLASLVDKDSVSVATATAQDMAVMATAPPEFTVDMVVMVDMAATEAMVAMAAAASVI